MSDHTDGATASSIKITCPVRSMFAIANACQFVMKENTENEAHNSIWSKRGARTNDHAGENCSEKKIVDDFCDKVGTLITSTKDREHLTERFSNCIIEKLDGIKNTDIVTCDPIELVSITHPVQHSKVTLDPFAHLCHTPGTYLFLPTKDSIDRDNREHCRKCSVASATGFIEGEVDSDGEQIL